MTIENVKSSIKNHILNSISHKDFCTLCNIFTIPITSFRKQNQKNLLDSILLATDLTLLHHILYMLNKSDNRTDVNPPVTPQMRSAVQNFAQNSNRFAPCNVSVGVNLEINYRKYYLSDELMDSSPIDVRCELVSGMNPQNIFVPNFTKYPNGYFNAPSCQPAYTNGRMNIQNAQLPYISKNTTIKASPFYCCQLVLHPLSLLIPKPTPNVLQPNRIMSKMQLSFTLSRTVRELITYHRNQVNNKMIYKWQILLRFGVYDPLKPFPLSNDDNANLLEYIPPYLSLSVNNVQVPLWDILPSNSPAKEGKRHSRPINISDYIKCSLVDDQGYLQIINVNWWQTPGIYLYYYAAVFLERKLDVKELLNQFVIKTHSVQRPLSFTLDFIREKFSNNNHFNKKIDDDENNDDDLIMSSVLPISLQCPVGKSRISCPLRSINCQHLQCFDAHLYLLMNERRSVWKCPVCDGSATLNELFVDEYFLQILKEFEHDEEISEVNVNPDGTYVHVAVKESREGKQHIGNIISTVEKPPEPCENENNIAKPVSEINPVIFVESDDDENSTDIKRQLLKSNTMKELCPSDHSVTAKSTDTNLLQCADTACTIDLTSDSEDDIHSVHLKDNSSSSVHHLSSGHTSPIKLSIDSQCQSKIIPKYVPSLSESLNLSSSQFIKDNMSLANNSFQRMPNNNRLLLPANKPLQSLLPNMMWMPPNNNYPYLYPKENINRYLSQSFFPNQKFSLGSSPHPSIMPGISHRCQVIETESLLPRPIKLDPYRSLPSYNEPLPDHTYVAPKKSPLKSPNSLPSTESQGSRRSTRIQHQDKKKYNELSGSSDEEDSKGDSCTSSVDRPRKRDNPHNDTESSGSSFSNKRKRK